MSIGRPITFTHIQTLEVSNLKPWILHSPLNNAPKEKPMSQDVFPSYITQTTAGCSSKQGQIHFNGTF